MPIRFTPILRLSIGMTLGVVFAMIMVGLATDRQSWLGMTLIPEPHGLTDPVAFEGVWIETVDPEGPAAGLPAVQALVAIVAPDGARIALEANDVMEEPDALASYAEMEAFFVRQTLIARALSASRIDIETGLSGATRTVGIAPVSPRPVASLPLAFWLQIGVGLVGFAIGLWIWSLRHREWSTRLLALAGAGLMISAFPAAIYSTRALAIEGTVFTVLSNMNHAGAMIFGIGMVGLFLVYPRRLVAPVWLIVPAVFLAAWHVAHVLRLFDGPATGVHLSIVLAMAAILVLVGVQFVVTRGDPRARAALTWLGLSVVVGAGAFVVTIALPTLFGLPPAVSQGEAFLFFLLIYVGVALGVGRYRLFQLDEWAFRILFYVLGVLLLIVIDAALILTIVDDRAPAFALSLVIVALLWLPLRDTLARLLLRRRLAEPQNRFRQVMDVALTPPGADQHARWRALAETSFSPLHVETARPVEAAALVEDGLELLIPGPGDLPALRLQYAEGGRRLFSLRDLDLATELHAMLSSALESRVAYEKGVAQERERIARDIHDNIGVQLMGALHSRNRGRKDVMIRETLTDLRDIVNDASRPDLSFDEMLADLRAQIAENLHAAGVEMEWTARSDGSSVLPLQTAHTLRSIIREAVQNALKHARSRSIAVATRLENGTVGVDVVDTGGGFDPAGERSGNGLANMRARILGLGGRFTIESGPHGTSVQASFPVRSEREDA